MMLTGIANFVLRGTQALFAVIIIGLSVTLIRGHHFGSLPWQIGLATFAGGAALVAALLGLAGSLIPSLEGLVGLIVDGVVAVVNIISGITMAVKLDGVKCSRTESESNVAKILANDMLTGGVRDGITWFRYDVQYRGQKKAEDTLLGHCREAQADAVFMFLTAGALLVSGLLLFLRAKKGY